MSGRRLAGRSEWLLRGAVVRADWAFPWVPEPEHVPGATVGVTQ